MKTIDSHFKQMHSRPSQINSLRKELEDLHQRLRLHIADIDRISFVAYEPATDKLKTYAESNLGDERFAHHHFPLVLSHDLKICAEQCLTRTVDDIPETFHSGNKHSQWLINHGYHSSYTVPVYNFHQFIGFVFFNSHKKHTFTKEVQKKLRPFCELITFVVNAEYSLLHAILASAELTKELSSGYRQESKEHNERVSRYAQLIANEVATIYELDDEIIENIHLFSRLHDIGKSALPTEMLLKPDSFAQPERDKMKDHVNNGIELLDKILLNLGSPTHPCINVLKDIISYHQEFLDGSGYPNGLSHADIPIPARIITVANIFDGLTSHRPYKQACSVSSALLELEKMVCAGKLDGNCVSGLRNHQDYLCEVIKQFPERDPSHMH